MWRAWRTYSRGKRRRPAVAAFALTADARLFALARALAEGSFTPDPYGQLVVWEPKERLVSVPSVRDRVLHQAIVGELGPTFERRWIDHSYASRLGRGQQRAVVRALGWTRRYRYRLHLDIAAYFASVDHDRLLDRIGRRLRDADTRALVERLVRDGGAVWRTPLAERVTGRRGRVGAGLPIGSALSQWSANLYLDGADHFVKRVLRVPAYLRYMDDLLLFGDDKGALQAAREQLADWLWRERGLELNPKHRDVVPTRVPLVFLGMRITRAGAGPSRSALRRMRARIASAALRGHASLHGTLVSYRGFVSTP